MVSPVIRSTSAPLTVDSIGLTAPGAAGATPVVAPPVLPAPAGGAATAPGVFAPTEPLVPEPVAPLAPEEADPLVPPPEPVAPALAWSSAGTGPPMTGVVRVRGTTSNPVAGQYRKACGSNSASE